MRFPTTLLASICTVMLLASPLAAQSANPLNPRSSTNPLNPPRTQASPAPQQAEPQREAEETKPRRQRRAKAEDGTETARPKREMSPAQKRNVEIMRGCGAEWRAKKDQLKPKGETWRSYLAKCRKQQSA